MSPDDCRRLSSSQQEEIRRRAVSMVEDGTPPTDVARRFKVGTSSIFTWLARYRSGGWGALKTAARSGRSKKLDGEKMRFVFYLVTNNNPLQLDFPFVLWTCEMATPHTRRRRHANT